MCGLLSNILVSAGVIDVLSTVAVVVSRVWS